MAFTISGGKRAPLPKKKKKRPGVPINPEVDFGTALGAPAKRPTYRQPSEVAKLAPVGVEKKVRDLVLPAFLVGQAFPDPDTVASAMRVQTPETLSPEMLDEFWQTYYQTNAETGQQRQFFQMPESEHPINALSNIFGITGKAGFRKTTYGDEQVEPEQVTWEIAGKHLQFIRDFQLRRDPYNQALTNVDEGYNIVEWKRDVAAKLKSVGMEVKFNPDDPSFDPDFEVAAKQILLGSQLVYSVLGDAKEQGITQEIFRNLLWTDFGEDELPKLLGVEQAKWDTGSTMESVVEALKANPAALQKVLYQGAMLGRPIGQSESRARYEYANKWGIDALPEEARQAYEEEAHGAVASLALAVKNAQEVYDAAVKLPWVGGALHVTGKVVGAGGKLVQYPFDSLMKTISSLDKTFFYDYQKGMTYDDWRAKVIANHGEDGLNFFRDLGVITDIGRFSETVDRYYAQGDTRYGSRVIEDVFLARTGEVTPLQKEIAQDADFFAMLGIAALVGDPLVAGAAKGVGRTAFKAGRKVAPKAAAEAAEVPASEVLVNRWFQTVAERMSQIDDDVAIARIYFKNHTPETKKLAKEIAKEKDSAKITDMLYGARDIGEFVDGGSAALGRAVRLNAYVNGKYEDSWIRNVYTPMHFGKVQTPRNPANMIEDIIVLTKFGKKKLDKADIDLQHNLVRKMYYADNMLEQQRIVDDFDAAVEKNIGPEGIAAYERFNHLYRRGRGLILKEQAQGVLYNAVLKNGEWVEGSRVIPTGTARRLVMERRQAKADLDAFVAERPEISPQAYQDALKTATKRMEEHIWALRKSAAYDEKAAYTRAELDEFDRAHDVLLGYSKPQPFDTWQMRKHLVFKYDPRVLHAMTQGKLSKAWTLTNAWAIDPVMKTWKELVMGNLGFPVRVQLMDEMARLVPEGIVTHPIQTAKALRYLKKTDIEGQPMRKKGAPDKEPQVSLYEQDVKPITTVDTAITGDYSAEWGISIKGSDPQYFTHFARYLDSMRSSVVIKRLLQKSNGELPIDRAQIKSFIKEARDENSEVGLEIRRMLEETGRTGRTTLDTVNYNRWVDDYATKILTLSSNPILRRAMKQHVTARELKKANSQAQALKAYQKVDVEGKPTGPLVTEEILPDELLFAVQRPDAGGVANLRVGNPLQAIPKFSPWHWIFNGMPWEVKVPLPGGRALDLQRASTVGAMSAMTRLTKDLTFSKKYWEVRNKILKQWERDGVEPDLQKLHTIAKGQAEQYMGAVTYTRSVTAGEDMLRNVIPFGSAYRQSMVYWSKTLAKHPVSMPYVYGNYPVDDPFFHYNDHSFYMIPMPYWAQNDPDTEGSGAFLESNWPMGAWWWAKPAALAAERLGADPETIAKVPGFGGVDMPVFKVLGDVFYGMGMDWNAGGLADALLGSIESRDRMHANFVAATLHYGEGPAKGSPEEHRERPWVTDMWEWLPGDKPEVIHNFLLKEIMPMPGSVRYEEDEAYKIRNAKGEYGAAVRDGDEARKAELRASDPTLDALLTYEDLDAEGKAAWRADPAHASLLKWIVTPYRWDKYKKELGVIEAQNSIYANGATALPETEYERGIHNAIARQRGGTILDERGDVLDVYPGDQARRVAEENLAKDLKRARTFILKQVDKLAKNGFDREVLMYMYDNPELNWRFWQAHLRKLGLNPEDYNPKTISALFEQQYGESYQDIARKEIPEEKILQARQFAKMIVGGDDLLESSPFYSIIAQSEKDQKDEVLKRLVYETGDQWFWMSPDKLELLGVKFTDDEAAEYVYVKSKLKKTYEKVAKLYGKSGYREARNAYWRLVDKALPMIKGGDLLQRGLADRMRKIPYFTQPQVTSIGYSYHAAEQWKAWHTYETIREEEWEKGRYDSQRLKNAWKLVGDTQAKTPEDMTPPQRRLQELGRVMLWDYVLMEAARMREELRSGYSEYYKDKGNSADSKEGEKRVKKLQGIINQATRYNKFFKRDIEKYFPKDMNLAYRLLSWYEY